MSIWYMNGKTFQKKMMKNGRLENTRNNYDKPVKPTLKDFAIGAVVLVPFVYLLINKKGGRK